MSSVLAWSTFLMLLYFNPCNLTIPVNIALIIGIAFMNWPAKTTVGA